MFWLAAPELIAVELKPKTLDAFNAYLKITQSGVDQDFRRTDLLLWVDRLPEPKRAATHERLRKGEVVIEALLTVGEGGRELKAPDALIHHWLGAVFVPQATLQQALALVQDYDSHQETFKPDVIRSRLLQRNGNEFEVFLRFFKKKVITVILNTTHAARFFPVDARRVYARSNMTRVAEVQNVENPDGPEKPPGKDHGFLWRISSEWRFEEKDGGVYIECESISLTRDIPTGLGWLVGPFVKSLPKETLTNTMNSTRRALMRRS